jgi:hypothetical protein
MKQMRAKPGRDGAMPIPHAAGIVVDGDADDGAWTSPLVARVRLRQPGGELAVPASEARFAWGDGHLYVLTHAADEDVRSEGDFFRITVSSEGEPARRVSFELAPAGPPPPAIFTARDVDGTIDDARDRDEEWLAEAAVPLSAIGVDAARGARLTLHVERCVAGPNDRCGTWSGGAVLADD